MSSLMCVPVGEMITGNGASFVLRMRIDAARRDPHYFHRDASSSDEARPATRYRDRGATDRRGVHASNAPTGRRRPPASDTAASVPRPTPSSVARVRSTARSHWSDSLNLAAAAPPSSSSSSSRRAASAGGVISAAVVVAVSCCLAALLLLLPADAVAAAA